MMMSLCFALCSVSPDGGSRWLWPRDTKSDLVSDTTGVPPSPTLIYSWRLSRGADSNESGSGLACPCMLAPV
jgi:hypothetical protein